MDHSTNTARLKRLGAPGHRREALNLDRDLTIFGRADTCHIVIDKYEAISREHCGIKRYEDGHFTITDYGSRNGTWVNGERIFEETVLKGGDRVRLCKELEFVFEMITHTPETDASKVVAVSESAILRLSDEIERERKAKGFTTLMHEIAEQARPKPRRPRTDS